MASQASLALTLRVSYIRSGVAQGSGRKAKRSLGGLCEAQVSLNSA
jgi:hypothetical protein